MRSGIAVGVFCLAVAIAAPVSPARAAKACSLDVIAGGPQKAAGEAQARHMARQHWRNSTAARLGPLWSNWNIADEKSIACRVRGAQTVCRAHAVPCKELGTDPGGSRYRLVR